MLHPFRAALLVLITSALFSLSARAEPVTYTLDPGHTDVVATWTHFGFSRPSAMFNGISGTVTYDPDQPTASSVELTIPVASVHTASADLNTHLQNADFFNVAKWPDMHFKSSKVVAGAAPNQLKVTGDLTVHGVTKPVTMDVTVNKLGTRHDAKAAAFNASFQIKRSDFDVGLYAPMVSDEVDITATTEAIESKAWAAMHADK